MINKERQNQILELLTRQNEIISVNELCKSLFTSESSVRRDLKTLEAQGLIRRLHGGAEIINNFSRISSFNIRANENVDKKRIIASKACSLICEGDVIFLDQSSTTFYLACELVKLNIQLTVVTNNVEIVTMLANSKINVMCSGGTLSKDNRNCLVGHNAEQTFEKVYANKVFFSSNSLSSNGIISDCSSDEIGVRRKMLESANKKYFLCDSSKFNRQSIYVQCRLEDVDAIIVDDVHLFPLKDKTKFTII